MSPLQFRLSKSAQGACCIFTLTIAAFMYWTLSPNSLTPLDPDTFDGKPWDWNAQSEPELRRLLLEGWIPEHGRLGLPTGTANLNAVVFPNESAITGLFFVSATIRKEHIENLNRFPNIEFIIFRDCTLEVACLNALPKWRSLKGIDATRSGIIDADIESVCAKFGDTLELLEVGLNKVSDSGLRAVMQVKQLRVLDVSGTNVTSRSLDTICHCRHLEWLIIILSRNQFSSRHFAQIRNAIPGIHIISGDSQ